MSHLIAPHSVGLQKQKTKQTKNKTKKQNKNVKHAFKRGNDAILHNAIQCKGNTVQRQYSIIDQGQKMKKVTQRPSTIAEA